ncbi:helix-turn-helix domain-containing protein [Variovorax ginsengisoli]|uniref:Transcriptional regulator of acetoin/glycerol metabolism n=1 Tax=Variovorax ginsengisoli TaxID=363844 RepID=A0ABT9S2N6_9BURK|nr:helix-turn-helix domain-containing protein [Variovorax ginsengisoli]MDP9898143.1 transcriptional regulator of acetoin/glycerol metabolism [Variovorax ginsengisoli]
MTPIPSALQAELPGRAQTIALARQHWIEGLPPAQDAPVPVAPWLVRSWQRCLRAGHAPRQRVLFNEVSRPLRAQLIERNRALLAAARPVLDRLSHAIADTRYFAILTDAAGLVIDVGALPAGSDAAAGHARDIARIGLDLSESAIGTSAIGAALAEQRSVWLHRGEHFFDDTSVYTCAGAPLFDPHGQCIGMLDLTGVNVVERPELQHLAQRSAAAIEDALVRALPGALLLSLNWPGCLSTQGAPGDGDGLLSVDGDGQVIGSNAAARQLLQLQAASAAQGRWPLCTDLFAVPTALLFDLARRHPATSEVPLWSGLRLQVQATRRRGTATAPHTTPAAPATPGARLRDAESAWIHQAVEEARGNVAQAALALGISRATVYRKLARGRS